MAFDEAGQTLHDPAAGLFAAYVDVTVIRVAHEPVAAKALGRFMNAFAMCAR
jgi:hypothetical protein